VELHDIHGIDVAAAPGSVWSALSATLDRALGSRRARLLARGLGCRETTPRGPPTAPGSTVPGFVVTAASAPSALVLEGRHRFAVYRLAFEITGREGGSRVTARTDATFPGVCGLLYRAIVLGPLHAPATRAILRGLRRRAERLNTSAPSSS